jgi:hypothetical protein
VGKTNIKEDPEEAAKTLENDVNDLAKSLQSLTDSLGPLMDFTSLNKEVKSLKDNLPTQDKADELQNKISNNDTEEVELIDSMFELCEKYPNDVELGAKVRELYNTFHPDSDDTTE